MAIMEFNNGDLLGKIRQEVLNPMIAEHNALMKRGGGFRTDPNPPQEGINLFSAETMTDAETKRDAYFTTNPGELAKYDKDATILVVLKYKMVDKSQAVEYQNRMESKWESTFSHAVTNVVFGDHSISELKDGVETLAKITTTEGKVASLINDVTSVTDNLEKLTTELTDGDFKLEDASAGKKKMVLDCAKAVSHFTTTDNTITMYERTEATGECKIEVRVDNIRDHIRKDLVEGDSPIFVNDSSTDAILWRTREQSGKQVVGTGLNNDVLINDVQKAIDTTSNVTVTVTGDAGSKKLKLEAPGGGGGSLTPDSLVNLIDADQSDVVFEKTTDTNKVKVNVGPTFNKSAFIGLFDRQDDLITAAKEKGVTFIKGKTHGYVRKESGVGTPPRTLYHRLWKWNIDNTHPTDGEIEKEENWAKDDAWSAYGQGIIVTGLNTEYSDWAPERGDRAPLASDHVGQLVYFNTADTTKIGHYMSDGKLWRKATSGLASTVKARVGTSPYQTLNYLSINNSYAEMKAGVLTLPLITAKRKDGAFVATDHGGSFKALQEGEGIALTKVGDDIRADLALQVKVGGSTEAKPVHLLDFVNSRLDPSSTAGEAKVVFDTPIRGHGRDVDLEEPTPPTYKASLLDFGADFMIEPRTGETGVYGISWRGLNVTEGSTSKRTHGLKAGTNVTISVDSDNVATISSTGGGGESTFKVDGYKADGTFETFNTIEKLSLQKEFVVEEVTGDDGNEMKINIREPGMVSLPTKGLQPGSETEQEIKGTQRIRFGKCDITEETLTVDGNHEKWTIITPRAAGKTMLPVHTPNEATGEYKNITKIDILGDAAYSSADDGELTLNIQSPSCSAATKEDLTTKFPPTENLHRIGYTTTDKKMYWSEGASWVDFPVSGSGSIAVTGDKADGTQATVADAKSITFENGHTIITDDADPNKVTLKLGSHIKGTDAAGTEVEYISMDHLRFANSTLSKETVEGKEYAVITPKGGGTGGGINITGMTNASGEQTYTDVETLRLDGGSLISFDAASKQVTAKLGVKLKDKSDTEFGCENAIKFNGGTLAKNGDYIEYTPDPVGSSAVKVKTNEGTYQDITNMDFIGDALIDAGKATVVVTADKTLLHATNHSELDTQKPAGTWPSRLAFTEEEGSVMMSDSHVSTGERKWNEIAYKNSGRDLRSLQYRFPEAIHPEVDYKGSEHRATRLSHISATSALTDLKLPAAEEGFLQNLYAHKIEGTEKYQHVQTFYGSSDAGDIWTRTARSGSTAESPTWGDWYKLQTSKLDSRFYSVLVFDNNYKYLTFKNNGDACMPLVIHQDPQANITPAVPAGETHRGIKGAFKVNTTGSYTLTYMIQPTFLPDTTSITWVDPQGMLVYVYEYDETTGNKKEVFRKEVSYGGKMATQRNFPMLIVSKTTPLVAGKTYTANFAMKVNTYDVENALNLDPYKNMLCIEPNVSTTKTGVNIMHGLYRTLGGLSFDTGYEVRMQEGGGTVRVLGEKYSNEIVEG